MCDESRMHGVNGGKRAPATIEDDSHLSIFEQTKGLSIYRGRETYKDVIGYDNAKLFQQRIMKGPDPVEVYVFIDEIEKQLSGFGSDLSGVSGEMMGKMRVFCF